MIRPKKISQHVVELPSQHVKFPKMYNYISNSPSLYSGRVEPARLRLRSRALGWRLCLQVPHWVDGLYDGGLQGAKAGKIEPELAYCSSSPSCGSTAYCSSSISCLTVLFQLTL